MLADRFVGMAHEGWRGVFAQRRTLERAIDLSVGGLCALGRRTVSRAICAVGRQHQDWSADYKLFSRSSWKEDALFDPVMRDWLGRYRVGPIPVALDDTGVRRSGRKIATASWQRDRLSPPFHLNLQWGQRFMQASVIYPHYREGEHGARSAPVRFVECSVVKKPGKRATEEERAAWREARRTRNLSTQGARVIAGLRERFDALGAADRTLCAAVDGSLCNRNILRGLPERVELIGRCRKDARLCMPAQAGSRRTYDSRRFTPESVRADDRIPWKLARVHYGGAWRQVRYKELVGVLWQRGGGRWRLRLIVLAPQPYKPSPGARTLYREPAYLLTTDLTRPADALIQCYLDRWQIEVNHRDEKDLLGVGQAQVWSKLSLARHPAFVVAAYSLLLVAALQLFGPGRSDKYLPLPKWRKKAKRASALDMIALLRDNFLARPAAADAHIINVRQNLVAHAYT
jgi:hypothetical protein